LGGEQHAKVARTLRAPRAPRAPRAAPAAAHFARDDNLLLVAARERASGKRRVSRPNVVFRDEIARVRRDAGAVERRASCETMLLAEDEVVRDRILEHEAALVAVFRDVRQTGVASLAY